MSAASVAADQPAIEVQELVHFYGERQALREVSLEVRRGEIFALLGPNGGGKTTLFRILSTSLMPSAGVARVCGHDVVREPDAVRRRLGVLFQSPSLDVQLSVQENLRYHGLLYGLRGACLRDRIEEALDRVGLSDRAGERVAKLSGGLRRRAELAKAMLHQPQVLILDEPGTGLDPGARLDLQTQIERLRQESGVTVVLTTHFMDEAESADRLAILDQGNVVAVGTPAELKSQVGGDVIEFEGPDPEALFTEIRERYGNGVKLDQGTVRLERPSGREALAELLPSLSGKIQSVVLRQPTLEDVFLARTGHRFRDGSTASREGG